MWPYSWTHVGTPSHLGHMDRVAATMPSQAHAGAAQEAPNIGQWEGQDVPLVRPSSCTVKGGIPSSRRYLPTYLSAWLVTPSWTVYRLPCHRLLPWLRVTFAMVSDAAWPGLHQRPWGTAPAAGPVGRLGRHSVSDPWGVGSFLSLGALRVHVCAVSWATWPLFTGVPTRCVELRARCAGPLGSCSPLCPLGVLCCVCGVLGHLSPVH